MEIFTWVGILLCVSQPAMFSGLNLRCSTCPACAWCRIPTDHVLDQDIRLPWGNERRAVTGAEIPRRLPHGVVQRRRRD